MKCKILNEEEDALSFYHNYILDTVYLYSKLFYISLPLDGSSLQLFYCELFFLISHYESVKSSNINKVMLVPLISRAIFRYDRKLLWFDTIPARIWMTLYSKHLWSVISSEFFSLSPKYYYFCSLYMLPLLFVLRLQCVYVNPFLLCFELWCCCLRIAITIYDPCYFKDLQCNDNPLFGVMMDVIKLFPTGTRE